MHFLGSRHFQTSVWRRDGAHLFGLTVQGLALQRRVLYQNMSCNIFFARDIVNLNPSFRWDMIQTRSLEGWEGCC